MQRSIEFEREGVRLACLDFGGTGSPVLLLHGLAGYAGEWSQTAEWLSEHHRVVAFDARGHGHSERNPRDLSRAALLGDAVYVIEQLDLGPCGVVGQSMGGLTALQLAATDPALVSSLVVAEAMPAAPDEAGIEEVERGLARWPVPFETRAAALRFFGGATLSAETWVNGLEHRDDGWWPRFDPPVMIRMLREASPGNYWQEWERIRCPTLIVRGGNGTLTASAAQRMVELLPGSRVVEIAGAGHDVHLERHVEWQDAVQGFLGQ